MVFLQSLLVLVSLTVVEALTAQQQALTDICTMVKSTDSTARTGMYEPANSCFAYIPATTTNGPPTLANSKSKCATLSSQVSSLGGTCMLGQLLDQATLANLSGQGVLKMGSKAFLNLRQLTSVVEPACDWYWVALDGSYVYPDPPILWYATEPDGAGVFPGGAHQGVFIYGLDSVGIYDETDDYPNISGFFCQCVGPPVASSITTTTPITPASYPWPCGSSTTSSTSTTTTSTTTPTTTSTTLTTTAPTSTSTTTTTPPPTSITTSTAINTAVVTTSTMTTTTSSTATSTTSTTAYTTSTTSTTINPSTTTSTSSITSTTTTKKPTTSTTSTKTTTTKKPVTTTKMSITSTIPPTQSSCSIVGVDPRVHLSSRPRNFKVYPNVEDCAAKCAAETNFTCKGFVWMGSKSGCVLHGKIDSPVIMQKNSRWFLIDLNCATVSPCYWPAKATNIDPTTISASKKAVNVQIHDHCQALCLLGVLQPACWAYAHSTDSAVTSGYNCYLFPALTQSQSNAAASGKFSLYQNQCKM